MTSRIDELEDEGVLYVCPCCDYHGHVDEFGETCPQCGIKLKETESD